MKLKTLAQFLDENPDITILGLAWACYWRIILTVYAVGLGVIMLLGILGAL